MNELKQRLPKYRLHKRSGHALVVLDGREIYLGKHGTSESLERYNREIAQWLQRGGSSGTETRDEITVAEVMAAYLKYAKGYYVKDGKPTREYEIIREVCRKILPLYSKEKASNFGPLALKTVRQTMIDEDWSRRYINKQMDRIKRMFRWAAAEELIPASIPQTLQMVQGLKKGRTQAREIEPVLPVADSIVERTLEYLPEVPADMVRLQRFTGMRPQEVTILRPSDVDRSGDVWTYTPSSHKTQHQGKQRTIFIGPKAQAVLLRYLVHGPGECCFQPRDSEAKRRAALHEARRTPKRTGNRPGKNRARKPRKKPGTCYSTGSYRRAIHRACDQAFPHPTLCERNQTDMSEAELEDFRAWQSSHRWSPNQLRHAAATEIRSKFGLEEAQVILGHSQADVTQVYADRAGRTWHRL